MGKFLNMPLKTNVLPLGKPGLRLIAKGLQLMQEFNNYEQ